MNRILILIALGLFAHRCASGQPKDSRCYLMIDTIQLPKAVLIDNVMGTILDSAIAMIKFDSVRGHYIPYCLEISLKDTTHKQQTLSIIGKNYYPYKASWRLIQEAYEGLSCLSYKNMLLLISIYNLKNSWLRNYIQLSEKKEPYYVYGFYSKNRTGRCISGELIRHDVTFHLWPGRRKPFSFDQYTFFIDDDSFIYDNELIEQKGKGKLK